MKTEELIQPETTIKKSESAAENIDLVNGLFTLNEAREVIFQLWTQDKDANFEIIDKRIAELEKEKERAQEFLSTHQDSASKLRLHANLKMEIVE